MLHVDTAALWRTLATDLRAYVKRRVGDPAATEDLLQEIFLRVHRKSADLRDDDRMAAWVFRIARNVVVDHLRARGRDPTTDLGDSELPSDADADSEETATATLAVWVAAMVNTLEPPYAEAVRLADLEGVSQSAAAERLGLSHSGFKSRVQRGRAKLRTVLDACCAVELDTRGGLIDFKPRKGCC